MNRGPTTGLTVALQPPETTGQDYKLSQEDEPHSSSRRDLWLGQFDWHPGRKHDAEVLCAWTLSKHSLLSFLWNIKGSGKISSGYFSCGVVLPCLASQTSSLKCHIMASLGYLTILFSNQIFLLVQLR